ncbi:MAG: hypothetical protein RLZZ337_1518 [Bacteroidota bacterium]|jgi:hypothetical protein
MLNRISVLVLGFFLSIYSFGQSPLAYLGSSYNNEGFTNYLKSLKNAEESFLPYLKTYKQTYVENGAVLEFNSDLSLYRITAYDSGYTFKQYKNELPYRVKWGQTIAQIEASIGALEEVTENPFVKRYSTDNDITDMYFTDGKLTMVRVTATTVLLQTKADEVFKAWGIRLLPDGKAIEGNCLDGNGTMMWGNGTAIYKGAWSYGLPHGKGEYVDSFGNKYSGDFKLGYFWGKGDYYSKSYGFSYSGDFIMSKRQGKGKITYANRTGYEGAWFQDEMRGFGKYIAGESYMYEGVMYANTFNGKGKLTTPDGTISGTFKNGKPHGYCVQTTQDGSQELKGTFKEGKKNGKFELKSSGTTKILYFEEDIEVVKNGDN